MAMPDSPKVGMFLGHIKGESKIKYMKSFFLTLGLALTLMSFTLQAPTDAILRSLKSASSEQVASHFDELLDMKLLENDEIKNLSRNQGAIALKRFFGEYNIKGFEKTSEREIGQTMYMTGKLLDNKKGFNITLMLKQVAGQYKIVTIRIS